MQSTKFQRIVTFLLGSFLVFTGVGHLTFMRTAFLAQVPNWVPLNADKVVVLSGIVEIILGFALILMIKQKTTVGWIVALFFVMIFPGNIAQLINQKHEFGLNSDLLLWLRLPLQPILITTVLWSTTAWKTWRNKVKNNGI